MFAQCEATRTQEIALRRSKEVAVEQRVAADEQVRGDGCA